MKKQDPLQQLRSQYDRPNESWEAIRGFSNKPSVIVLFWGAVFAFFLWGVVKVGQVDDVAVEPPARYTMPPSSTTSSSTEGGSSAGTSNSPASKPSVNSTSYISAGGNLWTGVKLYYGPKMMYVGEVLGGNERYVDPSGQQMRGIKIRYPDGSSEWKNRSAVNLGPWYVKADDPALVRQEWAIYKY